MMQFVILIVGMVLSTSISPVDVKKRMAGYRYKCIDNTFFSKYIMDPIWNQFVGTHFVYRCHSSHRNAYK